MHVFERNGEVQISLQSNSQRTGEFSKAQSTKNQLTTVEIELLRFLIWVHNDACNMQQLLETNEQLKEYSKQKSDLVYWRLNLPFFVLSRQIAKNLILRRTTLQDEFINVFPAGYVLDVYND